MNWDEVIAALKEGRELMVEVRDLLERKLDDHEMVIGHEHRLKALEERDR